MTTSMLQPSEMFIRKTEKEIMASVKRWEDIELSEKFDRYNKAIEHIIQFSRKHGLIVYGGQAINALLPVESKVYGKKDINDVDIYSHRPLDHAKLLAGELDDLFDLDFVEAKYSFMHDNSYSVFANGEKLADFTYMDKVSIDSLFLRIERNMQPMVPVEYLLYSMHIEFSHPLITPDRWGKTFNRFVTLLQAFPISYDKTCFETCIIKPEKELEKIITIMNKHLKLIPADKRPPIIGFGASVGMAATVLEEGKKAFKNMVPACDKIACMEVLSTDAVADALLMRDYIMKEAKLNDEIGIFRNGLWINELSETKDQNSEEEEEEAKTKHKKKAMDGQPLDEVILMYKNRVIASFVKVEVCSHFVISNDIVYGGIDTVLTFMYKRFLFGPSNKSPSSPTSLTLKCMIHMMYDIQFKSADRKKINMVKRFSTSECYGKHMTFRDSFQEQLDKRSKNKFYYKAYLPEEREHRRLERMKETNAAKTSKTGNKKTRNKKKS